jgi:peptidyl-tRNA hydrolase
MYALVRTDLGLSPGKAAAQAAHAILASFLQASSDAQREFVSDEGWTNRPRRGDALAGLPPGL